MKNRLKDKDLEAFRHGFWMDRMDVAQDWMSVSVLRREAAEKMEAEAVDVPVLERGRGQAPQGSTGSAWS